MPSIKELKEPLEEIENSNQDVESNQEGTDTASETEVSKHLLYFINFISFQWSQF